jgi:hypothetical protein
MSDLRDKRSGAYDRGTDEKQTVAKDGSKLTAHQQEQWQADVREGVTTNNIVPGNDIPEGLRRPRKGPYSKANGRRSVD